MGHWSSAGPTYYATARMHWAPEQTDAGGVVARWAEAFAPAATEMAEYVSFWESWTQATYLHKTPDFSKCVLLSHALSLTQQGSLWCRFSSNVTSARIANMARTSVHGSAYENMRFVYLSSLFDDADRLLAAARRACNGVDACEKRVAFMESGSKHGRLMAEG